VAETLEKPPESALETGTGGGVEATPEESVLEEALGSDDSDAEADDESASADSDIEARDELARVGSDAEADDDAKADDESASADSDGESDVRSETDPPV
jgi:hypothetical protein